jgi:hypothetical protein
VTQVSAFGVTVGVIMSKRLIQVNGSSLPIREYEGTRVVTLKDVAKVHQTSVTNLRSNFSNNKKHFKRNIDYFIIVGKSPVKNLGIGLNTTRVNVFTESGYLMLVKSLTDDLSWRIQRELVNRYFKVKQTLKLTGVVPLQNVIRLLSPQLQKLLSYRIDHKLTQSEAGKLMGISQDKVSRIEQRLQQVGIYVPTQIGKRPSYKNILEVM